MNEIIPRLFIGNYPDAKSVGIDNVNAITAILSVVEFMPTKGLKCLCIPLSDDDPVDPEAFDLCIGWLKTQWDAQETILVHCAAGVNRSVTMTAVFLVVIRAVKGIDSAIELIRKQRPAVTPPTATDEGCPKKALLESGRDWLRGTCGYALYRFVRDGYPGIWQAFKDRGVK